MPFASWILRASVGCEGSTKTSGAAPEVVAGAGTEVEASVVVEPDDPPGVGLPSLCPDPLKGLYTLRGAL